MTTGRINQVAIPSSPFPRRAPQGAGTHRLSETSKGNTNETGPNDLKPTRYAGLPNHADANTFKAPAAFQLAGQHPEVTTRLPSL